MKFKSELLTAASGSIGGTTYLRSAGALVRQARPRPTNANSPHQRAVRNFFGVTANAWSNLLSQPQRDAWSNYAALSPVTGRFGDPLTLSGHAMFRRVNTVRLTNAHSLLPDAPTTPGLTEHGITGVAVLKISSVMGGQITIGTPWANQDDGFLQVQTTRFLPPGRNYYSGGLRLWLTQNGQFGGSPVSFFGPDNAFGQLVSDITLGMKCLFRITACTDDGRLSSPLTQLVTAVM